MLMTPGAPTPTLNIVQLAESVKDLSTLVAAVVAGDLADTLSSPGPFTVFAPTNEAFAALPAGTLTKLMKPESKKELVDILTYHVLPEKVLSTDLKAFQEVKTVEGKLLQVTKSFGRVRVGASLHSKDLRRVTAADNLASNGVVHIIDGVLIPPVRPNIVKLAESVKDLSTLVAAVVAGDLADTLSSPGPFTVFAPTNEAFAALPAGTLSNLLKLANKKELVDILTYHVLPEQVLSTDLKAFQAVKTVEGKPLHVTKWGGRVRVGPSLESKDLKNVVKADNLASNGVVHIIDGVLLPPSSASIVV
jgi:transforming growth factor-beta-induced protein